MENLKEIIAEAKKKESWSRTHEFNYGPIDYLREKVLYNGGWSEENSEKYRSLIHKVTDEETYFVYLFIAYDCSVDSGQILWEMKQAFPRISKKKVWEFFCKHAEPHHVIN